MGYQFFMYGLMSTVFVGCMAHIQGGEQTLVASLLSAGIWLISYQICALRVEVESYRKSMLSKVCKRMQLELDDKIAQ